MMRPGCGSWSSVYKTADPLIVVIVDIPLLSAVLKRFLIVDLVVYEHNFFELPKM